MQEATIVEEVEAEEDEAEVEDIGGGRWVLREKLVRL